VINNGKLIPAIDHTGPYQMPKGGSMLSDCAIEKIKKWISNGAQNN
jgi:ribosomal protein S16